MYVCMFIYVCVSVCLSVCINITINVTQNHVHYIVFLQVHTLSLFLFLSVSLSLSPHTLIKQRGHYGRTLHTDSLRVPGRTIRVICIWITGYNY